MPTDLMLSPVINSAGCKQRIRDIGANMTPDWEGKGQVAPRLISTGNKKDPDQEPDPSGCCTSNQIADTTKPTPAVVEGPYIAY